MPTLTIEKTCPRCKKQKPLAEFRRNGRIGLICQTCKSERSRWDRGSAERREYLDSYARCERRTQRCHARQAVSRLVQSGAVIKPSNCPHCGNPVTAQQCHAHHADHSKPLEFTWCCAACHKILDGKVSAPCCCGQPHYCRGLCQRHYAQAMKLDRALRAQQAAVAA
jgi:hypothetical protein